VRRLSRRNLLVAAAGGAALATVPVRPASAATDDELAFANFGLAAAYLVADFYGSALEANKLGPETRRSLRRGRAASLSHARALSELIGGAGDTPAAREDFAFEWPTAAFRTAATTRRTGLTLLRATQGAYQRATAAVSEPSYRVLYASLAASIGQQIGALAAPGGDEGAEPFPPALDLEAASAALESYLG
jgi:hypothetical protein